MEFLLTDVLGKPVWMWAGFIVLVLALLALDLGVLHRKAHAIGMRESLGMTAFFVSMALGYAGVVWWLMGSEAATLYLTGYVVEYSLAMDNIFVIATIFAYFGIPPELRHRVLVYGILGVIVLRALMIGAGAAIVQEFEWVLYVFAAFLLLTGVKMLLSAGTEYDVGANPVLRFARRHLRVTEGLHGERFFVRLPGPAAGRTVLWATPLFLALVMIEVADIIFAVDSIPAIFAITTDPYLVYTSNIFAILGLRSLYFALSAMLHRFVYLKHALAVVLIFIGGKIFAADMLGLAKVPPELSLGATVAILATGVIASLWSTRSEAATQRPALATGGDTEGPE